VSRLPAWVPRVEAIIAGAAAAGRRQLYEHEVYAVLAELGLPTPRHVLSGGDEDIGPATLAQFGSERIVVKVVSPDAPHKQKLGGVKVVYKDLEFVRWTAREMRERFESRGQRVEGVLLVEFVRYSPSLGNETLLGFRESDAFGPVLSFSKGGEDAEHFATHFSPPNLVLLPVDREWASALLASTHIHKKYLAEGRQAHIDSIVDAEVRLSGLATHFSSFFQPPGAGGWVLSEFEVNPFVFDEHGQFVALDGYATFRERPPAPVDLKLQPKDTLRPLFEPLGVAIVGVSASDHGKSGNIILRNLLELGREDVHCVNRRGGDVEEAGRRFPLARSLAEVKDPVDLAIITVPAESSLPVVEDCARRGVKAILLIPGGFSEIDKNREAERRILEVCRQARIRLMGPNCLGVVYAGDRQHPGLNTFFIPEEKFKVDLSRERNVAILSQSGAMGIMELFNLRNAISPKVVVSYGNQLDIDPADLVQYFEDEPMVEVIGLYIEGFKEGAGRRFFEVTSRCRKPIIVYKAGRTEAGRQAAQSHTASIAGEYEVAKAAMKQAGLIVAGSMIAHGDYVKTFALLADFPVSGRRVAVIANAGYEKTSAADNLGELELAELDDQTIGMLREHIPPMVEPGPLLDLTAMISDEQFERCIDVMLSSPRVDALCISILPQAQVLHTTDQEIEHYEQNIAARIVSTVHKHKKPTVVSVNVVSGADAVYNRFGQVMDSGGVPTYLTAERAMVCLNEFIRYRLFKEKRVFSEWLR
jgi:3-hydroxypropionyl-CoA synthetase (ADP-forming)